MRALGASRNPRRMMVEEEEEEKEEEKEEKESSTHRRVRQRLLWGAAVGDQNTHGIRERSWIRL